MLPHGHPFSSFQRAQVAIMSFMKKLIAVCVLLLSLPLVAQVPTPEKFFGFRIGTDKKLARWDKIVEYFQAVAAQSDRVRVRTLGPTSNGNPFIVAEIASP